MIPLHSLHAVALRGTRSTTGAKISAENRTLLLDVPSALPHLCAADFQASSSRYAEANTPLSPGNYRNTRTYPIWRTLSCAV